MKFIINREALGQSLSLANMAVKDRSPKPALRCVKIVAKKKRVQIYATDLEHVVADALTQADIEKDGEALIPMDKLRGIVDSSASDTLTIQSDESDGVRVTTANGGFLIRGYPVDAFPPIAEAEEDSDLMINPVSLGVAIDGVTCAANDPHDERYAFAGVLMERDNDTRVSLLSTTGHSMSLSLADAISVKKKVRVFIPFSAIRIIRAVIECTGEEQATFRFRERGEFQCGDTRVLFALLEAKATNYREAITRPNSEPAVVDAKFFSAAMRQAGLFQTQETHGVCLDVKSGSFTITSVSNEHGEAKVDIPTAYNGEPASICVSWPLVMKYLRSVNCENIAIRLGGVGKATHMKGDGLGATEFFIAGMRR